MKIRLSIMLGVLCIVTACTVRAANPAMPLTPAEVHFEKPTPYTAAALSDIDWEDRDIFLSGLITAEQSVLDELPDASVYHIDLKITADYHTLQGHEAVKYTNQETVALDEIYFRLFANTAGGVSTVTALQVDGQTVEPQYEFDDSALRVVLPSPLAPGTSVIVQMDFTVEIAQEMGGNYGLFGYFDDVLVLDEFYPVIPVYDDEGWNVESPPPNADLSYVDASFYLVRVTAPLALQLIGSGVQVEEIVDEEAKTRTAIFAAGPQRDFYIAGSELYTVFSDTIGETTVNSYTFAKWQKHGKLALQNAINAIKVFNERFGTYPYTELDVVSTPMQAGGMEYPGVIAITLTRYDPQDKSSGYSSQVLLETTIAHEVAHQWFYNVVGNDQIDEPWLDEAMAQYLTGLYYTDIQGEVAAQNYRQSWHERWDRVGRDEIPIGLPAGEYVNREYGAIVYGRGPLFIQALAQEMGQLTFDAFIRDYYQTHKWGIATGEVFKSMAEQHCDCNLDELFGTWVNTE